MHWSCVYFTLTPLIWSFSVFSCDKYIYLYSSGPLYWHWGNWSVPNHNKIQTVWTVCYIKYHVTLSWLWWNYATHRHQECLTPNTQMHSFCLHSLGKSCLYHPIRETTSHLRPAREVVYIEKFHSIMMVQNHHQLDISLSYASCKTS